MNQADALILASRLVWRFLICLSFPRRQVQLHIPFLSSPFLENLSSGRTAEQLWVKAHLCSEESSNMVASHSCKRTYELLNLVMRSQDFILRHGFCWIRQEKGKKRGWSEWRVILAIADDSSLHMSFKVSAEHAVRPYMAAQQRIKDFVHEHNLRNRPHALIWLSKVYGIPDVRVPSVGRFLSVKSTVTNWPVLRECGQEPLQFYWFRATVKVFNSMLNSNSETLRRVMKADLHLPKL
eukprot:1150127-Pelagomonas_calceolata.AAC.2